LAVDVADENLAAIIRGPIVTLINHQPRMSMTATSRIRTAVARVRTFVARIMHMIRTNLDIVINKRIEVRTSLPGETPALHQVEQMRNPARLTEKLPMPIKINAPRVARSFRKNFKNLLRRMISPDAGIDMRALAIRCAGFADI